MQGTRKIKNRLKNIISSFMAFVMFFNTAVWLIPHLMEMKLFAAAFALSATFDTSLTDGRSRGTNDPYRTSIVPPNSVMMAFEMPVNSSGVYVLEYPLANGRYVQFIFDRTLSAGNQIAVVSYREYSNFNTKTEGAYGIYNVYSNNDKDFIFYKDYLQYNYDQSYMVHDLPSPTFTIVPNSGFSFQVSHNAIPNTIHFLWENNYLYMATDGISDGILYDFTLKYYGDKPSFDNNDPPAEQTVKSVFHGFSMEAMTVAPFSQGIDTSGGSVDRSGGYVFDWTGGSVNPNAIYERPGAIENKIQITFSLPKKWDTLTNTFTRTADQSDFAVVAPGAADLNITLRLKKDKDDAEHERVIILSDIFNGSGAPVINNGTNDYLGTVTAARSGDAITVTVDGLPPSLLYMDSSLILGGRNNGGETIVVNQSSKIDPYAIYTYMGYEYIYDNGSFWLEVQPYSRNGYYLLSVSRTPDYTLLHEASEILYSDGGEKVRFLLSIAPGTGVIEGYQIAFKPSKFEDKDGRPLTDMNDPLNRIGVIFSQMARFRSDDSKLDISLPTQFEIIYNDDMKPLKDYGGVPVPAQEPNLSFGLRWNIAPYSTIQRMLQNSASGEFIVKYEIYKRGSPIGAKPTVILATVEVRFYMTNGNVYADFTAADAESEFIIAEATGIDLLDDTNTMYNNGSANPLTSMIKAYFEINAYAFDLSSENLNLTSQDFYYPEIYFLNVGLVKMNPDGTESNERAESLFGSLTLNDFSGLEVPTVIDISASVPDLVQDKGRFNARWTVPLDKILEYVNKFLPYDNYDVTYNLYITQDESELTRLTEITGSETVSAYDARTGDGNVFTALFDDTRNLQEKAFYFSQVETANATFAPMMAYSNANPLALSPSIDALRNGGIVRIADIELFEYYSDLVDALMSGTPKTIDFAFEGLDKNQKYYIAFDVSVTFHDDIMYEWELYNPLVHNPIADYKQEEVMILPDPSDPDIDIYYIRGAVILPELNFTEHSKMSAITGITTKGDPVAPSPSDKTPPAPKIQKRDVGYSTATVYWQKIVEIMSGDPKDPNYGEDFGTLEYEVLRLRDFRLTDELLTQRERFDSVYNNKLLTDENVERAGFRISENALRGFSGNGFTLNLTGNSNYGFSFLDEVSITDNTLAPNNLYFYYVRTVRVLSDGTMLYSSWDAVSVTTKPVAPPLDLTVIRSGYVYDSKTEIVLSFLAPINSSQIGSQYDFQLSWREDNEPWSEAETMDAAELIARVDSTPVIISGVSYYRYYYIITDLKPGSAYSFMVRTYDIAFKDASVYSNPVMSRTDFDQDEYDNDKKTDDLMEYLREQLSALIKDPYWTADNTTRLSAVYRPTMFDALLAEAYGSQIHLATQNANSLVYYIPQSALVSANERNASFVITHGDLEIVISQNAIDTRYNEIVKQANERIKEKNAADYYVRVTVSFTQLTSSTINGVYAPPLVNGYEPATEQIDVKFEIVTSKENNKTWDNGVLSMLVSLIESDAYFADAISMIKYMVDMGDATDEILSELDKYINRKLPDLHAEINRSLLTAIDKSYSVTNLQRPVLLKYSGAGLKETLNGFQKVNNYWVGMNVQNQDNTRIMSVTTGGTFIFNKYTIGYAGLSGMENSEQIAALITKYGLNDYLGAGAAFDINAIATLYMVAGITARIGGAQQSANPADYLRAKGYSVSLRNNNQTATVQETIYLMMAVYEMKTGTNVASIQITNYSLTANIKGINQIYLRSVQAAFELGVYADRNMNPAGTVTVKDILNMLGVLNNKIGL